MENPRKLLVADQDLQSSSGLAAALRRRGHEVFTASDAVFVLTMALRHKPDAVILGARLPGGGALLALRRLRASVHTAAIPILAMAEAGRQKQALLAAGAEDCMDLPAEADEIIAVLESRLGGSREVEGAPDEILRNPERLAALGRTGMMDSAPDEELDIVTRMGARLLDAPVALVSLVDEKRQFFKSQVGLPEPWDKHRQTRLSHSFCQWVVSSDQELVVEDARTHEILRSNGAVSDLGVVAYAGVPVSAATGETIGSFCAIDGKPRPWNDDELTILRDLGQVVDAYSALNQATRAPSRATTASAAKGLVGLARLLQRYGDMAPEREALIGMIERYGHKLIEAAELPAPDPRC